MTDEYTHLWPNIGPVISPEAARLQWSHSVHEELNYLSEWHAQEHASTLAGEMGSSSMPRIDVFSLPKRKKSNRSHVTFCDAVEVSIGHDDAGCFRSTLIEHDTLVEFHDKPWSLRSRHPCDHVHDVSNFDETSLMARRPSQPSRPPSCSASSSTSRSSSTTTWSSSTSSEDWRQTVLVLLDGRVLPVRLPWNNAEAIVPLIQQAIRDPAQDIYGAHYVRHRPQDLIHQRLECLLIQTDLEPRPSTFLRLVLVDLEIFEPNEVLPGTYRRFSRWLPETINRISVFRLLGLEQLLHDHPDRAHLQHNNIAVRAETVSPLHLNDGDYVHVTIGEHEDGYRCIDSSPTSFQTDDIEDEDELSTLQAFWRHSHPCAQKYRSDADPWPHDAMCISRATNMVCGRKPIMQSTNEPYTFFTAASQDDSGSDIPDPFRNPPRVEQPVWVHAMWDLLRERGDVEMDEEGPVVYVATHYISHEYHTMNQQWRPMRFETDHATWTEDVKFMWEDLFDHHAPFEIHFVDPTPPIRETQSFVATILIVQHPRHDRVAWHLTVQDSENQPDYIQSSAHSTRPFMPVGELITISGHEDACRNPTTAILDRCQLRHGQRALPLDQDIRILDGGGLALILQDAPRNLGINAHDPPAEEDDNDEAQLMMTDLYVHRSCGYPPDPSTAVPMSQPQLHGIDLPSRSDESAFYGIGTVDPTQRPQQPLQWNPQAPDEFLNDLFEMWDLLAFTWEDEPRSGTVLVWFVDHQWENPICLAPRAVRLYPALHEWRLHIWQAWVDLIVTGAPLDYYLVTPKPPTAEQNILAHVLLVQRPQPDWATTIISWSDVRLPHPDVRQLAITTRDIIHRDAILRVLGLEAACNAPDSTLQCVVWHRDFIIQHNTPMPGRSGLALLMQISHRPVPVVAPPDHEDNAMLQTLVTIKPRPMTLVLDDLVPQAPKVVVDFTCAAEAYYAIMNILFEFLTSWPKELDIPLETEQAFATLQEYDNTAVKTFHFYVDGSKVAGHGVGAATICLFETDSGISLAGALATQVDFAEHAYIGEHAAMLQALLWAVQLSTWHMQCFPNTPAHFSFNFDALNTGYQAAGWWRAHEHKEWQVLFRSLAQILENRHGSRHLWWRHIRAHAQHPWNELVDRLAKYASTHPTQVGDCGQWHHWLSDAHFLTAIQWIWYLEAMRAEDPHAAPLYGLHLEHSLSTTSPDLGVEHNDATTIASTSSVDIHIDVIFATANVLTLTSESGGKCTSVTRQRLLMQQFHDAGCHVVGLQETRHRQLRDHSNPHYHIVGAPATGDGQDGVQLWISKTHAFYTDGPCVRKQDILIVAADPAYLIVKVRLPQWKCLLVTARAPHSGHGFSAIEDFWTRISTTIRRLSRTWPTFFLGDTNGHLGELITTAVGGHHARKENDSGTAFHNWLLDQQLFVPATFRQYQVGDIQHTFVAPDGESTSRIDYIALPTQLHYDAIRTWVDDSIDISTQRVDHLPTLCHWTLTKRVHSSKGKASRVPLQGSGSHVRFALQDASKLHSLREAISMPAWTVDPHRTAEQLTWQSQRAVADIMPSPRRPPRKTHVSDATWALVEKKKSLFRQLRNMKRMRRHTILKAVFQAWSGDDPSHRLLGWLPLCDRALATTSCALRAAAREVTTAIRAEDAAFYAGLAQRAAATYTVEGLTALWKHIKAVLPKNRLRQSVQRFDIHDELLRHFEHLEAGTTRLQHVLHQRCAARNEADLQQRPAVQMIDLAELPSLAETEELCMKQKPNKAPGPDGISSNVCRYGAVALSPHLHGLMLKAFLSAVEPCRHKGGYLVPIWKQKGSQNEAASYRGILLSDSFGKVYHAWLRRRLLPTMLQRRALGQLGGLPSQQTTSGIQILRLHGRLGRAKRVSTAVVFVDLRSAFHHLLREFVFNDASPMDHEELAEIFNHMDFDLPALAEELRLATLETPDDIPPGLRRCLADVHQNTWFKLDPNGDVVTETRRGTRPGSPLADIGFNLLMSRMVTIVHEELNHCKSYQAGQDALGAAAPPVTWVDDLAVPLAVASAEELIPMVQETTAILHATFQRFGMSLNMDKGKTEVVLMYRGREANKFRTKMFDTSVPPTIVTSTPSHVLTIRVVPSYRHLGARYTMDLDINEEVASRMAMAKQSYEELRHSVFGNRSLAINARVTLYDSLILSRLLYGCSAWSDIPGTLIRQLDAMIVGHHRRMRNEGFWKDEMMTDDAFVRQFQIQTFRLHLARHRLVYAQHLARHALLVHRDLLHKEFDTGKGWLCELAQDLRWLKNMVDIPFDIPINQQQWNDLWPVLASWPAWKRLVSRAITRHLAQEKIAWEVESYHDHILAELRLFGGEVDPGLDQDPSQDHVVFRCDACPQSFPSGQQLALHAFRVHGVLAQERHYVQSTICPGCLRDHHTTFRVTQHLRYRRNGCWDRVHHARQPADPVTIELPDYLKKVKRLPAVRRHHGPIRPTSVQRERIQLKRQIAALREEGKEECAWWFPSSDDPLVQQSNALLQQALREWCNLLAPTEVDFHNMMFGALFALPTEDPQRCRLFIHWVETHLHDDCPQDLDPDTAILLEQAYMSVLADLPTWAIRHRMKELTQRWIHLPNDYPEYEPRLAPEVLRPYNRLHPIEMTFGELGRKEQMRKQWTFRHQPLVRPIATEGPFFIIHLYSGRRREGDFQYWMERCLADVDLPLRNLVHVISLDTAIHSTMNVHSPALWNRLLDTARAGRLLAMLLGPPCETWSAARNNSLQNDEMQRSGPRPLRNAMQLWGMELRNLADLLQLSVGNCLLLKGLWLAIAVSYRSGSIILEHPAVPYDPDLPSIWRTGLVCMLLRRGAPFRKLTIHQWRFGSEGIKPTTLLYSHGSLSRVLHEHELPGVTKPTTYLLGRESDGSFRTAKAKEYPSALSHAFAAFFFDSLHRHQHRFSGDGEQADQAMAEFIRHSSKIEGTMMPDYQPV